MATPARSATQPTAIDLIKKHCDKPLQQALLGGNQACDVVHLEWRKEPADFKWLLDRFNPLLSRQVSQRSLLNRWLIWPTNDNVIKRRFVAW